MVRIFEMYTVQYVNGGDVSSRMRWAGHVACRICEEKSNYYRICLEHARKPRRVSDDNIKIDINDTEYEGVDWVDLAEDRDKWRADVKTVMTV
jgi:hypothetical protein